MIDFILNDDYFVAKVWKQILTSQSDMGIFY